MQKTILVVDDERALANTLCAILIHSGYNAIAAYDAAEALELMRSTKVDLLISDVVMPGMNGIELARRTAREFPSIIILLISGNALTQQLVIEADTEGRNFELLAKPVLPKKMLAHIESLFSRAASQQ